MQATSLRIPVASYTSDDEDDRQRCQNQSGNGASGGNGTGNASGERQEKGLARLRSHKNH